MTPYGNPEAGEELEHLLRCRPSDSKLRSSLALVYAIRAQAEKIELGDPGTAIATYEQAIAVAPNVAKWCVARADALASLAKSLELHEKVGDYFYVGASTVRLEGVREAENPTSLYQQAIEDYTMALERDPLYTRALMGRGEVLTHMGEIKNDSLVKSLCRSN